MKIVAEYQGVDADQAIWQYFRRHWLALFPRLNSRSTFVRQAANLWQYKELLQQRLAAHLRKLLAHTVCRLWLNRHSPEPLQFDGLVTQ